MGTLTDLNKKERAFVEAYCGAAKFNGAEAARLAGYAESSARVTASKLLTKANVQDAIQAFMAKASEKALVTTADVVEGLLRESKFFEEGSSPSARVSALKALSDYTGGFDANVRKVEANVTTHESFLDNLE